MPRPDRREGGPLPRRRRRSPAAAGQAGAVLLEVVVALALLAVAGIAAIGMAAEAGGAVSRARASEGRARAGSNLLEAVALWTREDLDRRLGSRRQGPFVLTLGRPGPELYTAVLADSATGRVLFSTSIFRRDTADALP